MSTTHGRLGQFNCDVRGKCAQPLKGVNAHQGRVPCCHDDNHGFANGSAKTDHERRKNSAGGSWQNNPCSSLPDRSTTGQRPSPQRPRNSYTIPDDGVWETEIKGQQLPKIVEVQLEFKYVEYVGIEKELFGYPLKKKQ